MLKLYKVMAISEKRKEQMRVYQEANKEKLKESSKAYREANKEKLKEYGKAYYEANKEKIKERKKPYNEANKEKRYATSRAWRKANPERARALYKKAKEKSLSTPEGRLINNMRSRIHKIIKINQKVKNKHTLELLECSIKFLKQYIQKRFKKGMTWDNYGEWHIDHVIPINHFLKKCNFNSLKVQKKCFSYKNLKPEWATYNLSKGSKLL